MLGNRNRAKNFLKGIDKLPNIGYNIDIIKENRKETIMLNTVEFGLIRIVEAGAVDRRFDVLVGYDLVCEWAFWQLADGEVVAVEVID